MASFGVVTCFNFTNQEIRVKLCNVSTYETKIPSLTTLTSEGNLDVRDIEEPKEYMPEITQIRNVMVTM